MSDASHLVTAEELERLPDDDNRFELVRGRVIRMSPVGFTHARIVARLCHLLGEHVRRHQLGVVGTELGVKLASNPDTVRGPDVTFIRRERIPAVPPRGFWTGPPDLIIEMLSPDDRFADVRAKVDEYLRSGVPLVVVIDPDRETALMARAGTAPGSVQGHDARLELADIVAGFSCALREVFE